MQLYESTSRGKGLHDIWSLSAVHGVEHPGLGFNHVVEQYSSQRCALPSFPTPSKLTVECSKPFRECLLVRCTETEVLVFCNQLHAVGFTPGDGVNFDRIDDVGQRDDQLSGVFLFILIKCYVLWSQDRP